jgi:hypothetical protein
MRARAHQLGLALLAGVALIAIAVLATGSPAAPRHRGAPEEVTTSSDPGKAKLDDALRQKVDAGQTADVPVFVAASGDLTQVRSLLVDDHTAKVGGSALLIGKIGVQAAPKLAGLKQVISVGLIQSKKTGAPLGDPDPALRRAPTRAQLQRRSEEKRKGEVPFDKAPPLQRSNFEELKKLGVMDAKTHNFAEAWRAGFAGEGTTVGVLDGGTDFGHPDLIGTWQTWSDLRDDPNAATDDGWNGWPKAFDPFGVLQLLVAPGDVANGLSWYTPTTAATCGANRHTCRVTFATRTGPSRNFSAPAGTATHVYKFPREWTKSGTVRLGTHPDDHLLETYEERPAFLVVDSTTAGAYDTVYVDLDDDHSFKDEKPVTRSSPASYRDMDGNGLTDISGGLLYFIADGKTKIPGGYMDFAPTAPAPAPGTLLAWSGDFDPAIEGHGTLTASNIVGQGVINGKAPQFEDLPGDGRVPGAVIGGAPKAKLAPYGDIYFGFDFSTQFGYLLSVLHGVDITSNSYGTSDTDNDGYDAASQEADIIHDGSQTTPLFSSGNGAPGFGTTTPPAPSTGVKVGASTQYGATGWDSLTKIRQAPDNDVSNWSDRGPGATGSPGIDLVADGAYSAGDLTLNDAETDETAWVTWGGTSRSTPVAVGATALLYQAYRKSHGGNIPNGFSLTAKRMLKSSAQDLGYDSFIQGSGSLDAGQVVRAARGSAQAVSPDEWRVGDYRGEEHQVFSHIIAPGGSDTQTFNVNGPGTWSVSDRYMKRTDRQTFDFTTASQTKESAWSFNAPDYLLDISNAIKAHPNADLMVVRANYPHNQLDNNGDYNFDQEWRLFTYRWTDANHDHKLWVDRDHDGVVDHVDRGNDTDIDGNPLIDYRRSEIQGGEYVRYTYHNAATNSFVNMLRDPKQRMGDGVFIGFEHKTHNAAIDKTNFKIQVDFYENTDWPWLTHSPTANGSFTARLAVPPNTPYGMYEGAIVLSRSGDSTVIPVSVAVAARPVQDADGNFTGTMKFGGRDVAAAQDALIYNNGSVFGANDWSWRAESGDWRFFFYDVGKAPPDGTQFLADTTWDDAAPFTDLDTLFFGPGQNSYVIVPDGAFGGPYILDTVGKSPNTNTQAGVWQFNTATGGNREVVAAPAQEGLHALVQHQVGWQGDKFHVPFETTVGSASVTPTEVEQTTTADTGSFDVTFKAGVPLDGLEADGFGLSQKQSTQETAAQDDPDDPSTASVKKNLTLAHASRLTVATTMPSGDDIDLFVVYDANNDGTFALSEIVASSATGGGDERVDVVRPPDGNYQIWGHGFGIVGNPPFTLDVTPIQGNDLTVSGLPSGPVPAGTPVTIHVAFSKAMTAGQDYLGELLLGPPSAPSAFKVPITIHRK